MTEIDPRHRVVLIRLTASYPRQADSPAAFRAALYDAASKWWKISAGRTVPGPGSPDYAFVVHQGTVRAVYAIGQWRRAPDGNRFGFSGTDSDELEKRYLGEDVSEYFPKGAANPLRFVNCGTVPNTSRTTDELREIPAQTEAERLDEITSLAQELAQEPLAHIMYGGRELFHSNLLGWFAKAMCKEASDVFDSIYTDPSDPEHPGTGYIRRADRELHNLDLALWWDDHRRPMVIENKVFSLPDPEQLDRYAELLTKDVELKGARQILLSLHDPGWDEDTFDTADRVRNGAAWHRVSYGTLAAEILKAIPESDSSYEAETMRRYAKLIGHLQKLADLVRVNSDDEQVLLPPELESALQDRRLFDSLSKLRARSIAQLIQAEIGSACSTVEVDSWFSNGSANISAFHRLGAEHDSSIRVGWQVQGADFRLFVILPHLAGRSKAKLQNRIDWANRHPQYFDFTTVDPALGTAQSPVWPKVTEKKPTGFNKYDPDFIYRSKKVPSLTVKQLLDAATSFMIERDREASGAPG